MLTTAGSNFWAREVFQRIEICRYFLARQEHNKYTPRVAEVEPRRRIRDRAPRAGARERKPRTKREPRAPERDGAEGEGARRRCWRVQSFNSCKVKICASPLDASQDFDRPRDRILLQNARMQRRSVECCPSTAKNQVTIRSRAAPEKSLYFMLLFLAHPRRKSNF